MTDDDALLDITPDDSVTPVLLDQTPTQDEPEQVVMVDVEALRASAMQALMTGQPLTAEQAAVIVGS